jgi:hypothetical protein
MLAIHVSLNTKYSPAVDPVKTGQEFGFSNPLLIFVFDISVIEESWE